MPWIITYKNSPATIGRIASLEPIYYNHTLDEGYMVAKTKRDTIEAFIQQFGFTWKERSKGVDCHRIGVVKP